MIEAGIAGLPNAGKTTLFNTLTKNSAQCASYRFTTIKPNIGIAEVPDERLTRIASAEKCSQIIPAAIKFIDVAGLIEGAHRGDGLGNQFLADLRTADVICHCVRGFDLESEPEPDVIRDADIINIELIYSDIELIERRIEKIKKRAESGDEASRKELEVLNKAIEHLNNFLPLRKMAEEIFEKLKKYMPDLLTSKPLIYVLNTDDPTSEKTRKLTQDLIKISERDGASYCVAAPLIEQEIACIDDEAEREEMKSYFGISESSASLVAKAAYEAGNLITFFTTANQICQAWELKKNSTIIEAAEKVHTDIARGFIKAEIVRWEDLVEAGSWSKARENGKVLLEGREYIVRDGDVIFFKFSR